MIHMKLKVDLQITVPLNHRYTAAHRYNQTWLVILYLALNSQCYFNEGITCNSNDTHALVKILHHTCVIAFDVHLISRMSQSKQRYACDLFCYNNINTHMNQSQRTHNHHLLILEAWVMGRITWQINSRVEMVRLIWLLFDSWLLKS